MTLPTSGWHSTSRSSALEYGDRFDMRRVRKHVHDPCGDQPKPLTFHQNARVTRETTGMAGNIHDSARTPTRHPRDDLACTGARRIEQNPLVMPQSPGAEARGVEEIFRKKAGIADIVQCGVRARLGEQPHVPLDADDRRTPTRQGQREIARSEEHTSELQSL